MTLHLAGVGLFKVMAHKLVFVLHGGVIPDGYQINHKNCIKDDNRFENLEACDQSANMQHSYANGRNRGRPWKDATIWRDGRVRITAEQKQEMRDMRRQGDSLANIALKFGLSKGYTHKIVKGVI